MIKQYEKDKIVETLRENPIVLYACQKAGIAPSTFYRLCQNDKFFRDEVEDAMRHGRAKFNDIAESVLLKKVKEENLGAVRYWLGHNSNRYRANHMLTIEPSPFNPPCDHDSLFIGHTCKTCGFKRTTFF